MSFVSLPDELLHGIFSLVHDQRSLPSPISQRTFSSLCRVSKRLLPLARAFLYYRPLPPSSVSWHAALNLATSLTDYTGSHVVSLEGIVDFVSRIGELEDPRYPTRFRDPNFTEAFSLYCALLRACPRVETVELLFNTSQHLTKLLQALKLASLSSTLATVRFVNSPVNPDYEVNDRLVINALQRKALQGIKHLELENVRVAHPRYALRPSAPASLESLRLKNISRSFWWHQYCFPVDSSGLRSLSLELISFDGKEVTSIFETVPTALERLSLVVRAPRYFEGPPRLLHYLKAEARGKLLRAPKAISRLVALKSLALRGFSGPSLELLSILSTSAPKLSFLDFTGSVWIPSNVSTSSSSSSITPSTTSTALNATGTSIEGIIDEALAIEQLSKFGRLVEVKLGILPTTRTGDYQDLKAAMVRQGVDVEWEVCNA